MKESDIQRIAGIGFDGLVEQIRQIDDHARRDTARAVNIGLTVRNWSIGFHIDHYELKGADRSQYGDELYHRLADGLRALGVKRDGRLLDEIRRLGLGLIHQWNLQSMRLWGSTQPLTDAIRSASGKQMPRSRGQSDQWSGHCRHRIPEDDEPFSSSGPTGFPRKNAVTCFCRTSCGVQFLEKESGRHDLNVRLPRPKRGALAKLSYAPV